MSSIYFSSKHDEFEFFMKTFFSVSMNRFRRLLNNLKKLRGKSVPKTKKSKSCKKISKIIATSSILEKQLPSEIRSDPRIENILKKHRNFLKLEPLSPLPNSPKVIKTDAKILKIHSNFLKLKPLSRILASPEYFTSRPVRKIENNFGQHAKFPELESLSPNYNIPKRVKLSNSVPVLRTSINFAQVEPQISFDYIIPSRKTTRIPYREYKLQTCNFHFSSPPKEFCTDCFITNYFGQGFYCNPQLLNTSEKFKRDPFPSFEKLTFERLIEGTEIPIFNSKDETPHQDPTASCQRHIFTPTHDGNCNDCITINDITH